MFKKIISTTLLLLAIQVMVKAQFVNPKEVKNKKMESRLQFGGYGEITYKHYDYSLNPKASLNSGTLKENRATIDIPRFVMSIDYDFGSGFSLSTEIEYEHGGTGGAMEFEYDEMGEYEVETEKGGEVVLEQFHLTKRFSSAFNLRVGHLILALGLTNKHHLPTEYFTSSRPESETAFLPSTWHETGLEAFGQIRNWRYKVQLVNGLDANGFSSNKWVAGAVQTKFEMAKATNMAFVGDLEYAGIEGVVLGGSIYTGKSTKNIVDVKKLDGLDGKVNVYSLYGKLKKGGFIARANFIKGDLSDSYAISKSNASLPRTSQYPKTPVAEGVLSYGAELGYNVLSFLPKSTTKLYPFIRYDYFNSMEDVKEGIWADPRCEKKVYTFGMNWFVRSNIAVKADYSIRKLGTAGSNNERTFACSVVFAGVFK
jgi:hypothetical protein